jgi:hypothetical protein
MQSNIEIEIERLKIYAPLYWNYLEQLPEPAFIDKFKTLQNVKTALGKGRAWIRAALNARSLERFLSALTRNVDLTKCVRLF